MKVRISLGFQQYTDEGIATLAGAVIKGMTGHMVFSKPPVEMTEVQAALNDYNAALAANVDGGLTATATKNNKRELLTGVLRKLAYYVQTHSNDDLETLSSSGFPVLPARPRSLGVPAKPSILSINNGNTTELVVRTGRVLNVRFYELHMASMDSKGTPGEWKVLGLFSKVRIPVTGLTPGTTYVFQVRALGSAGFSDLSDPVSHVCW